MKSIIQVLSANVFVTLIGILQTLLLPLILDPLEYGYWSLYVLYVSYAGFIIFGFCDGFYLKHGGINYKNIDKKLFSFFHIVLIIYLVIILLIWELYVFLYINDEQKRSIFMFIGIGGFLFALRSYYVLFNQATARFKIYSFGVVIEKIIILAAIILYIQLPNINSSHVIIASVLGKIVTIIYFVYQTREIIFSKTVVTRAYLKDSWNNVTVGFSLTLSGIGIMLISGFGRFFIEKKLGIVELGLYSFMFTISLIFSQTILAISSVLFPTLKRIAEERAKYLLEELDGLIIYFSSLILLMYYPARLLLENIFIEYTSSMQLLIFLFPIIVSQARMSLVFNTLYKVLRYEKQLMINVLYSLVVCVLLTMSTFEFFGNKESVALATYLTFCTWNIISIYFYNKLGNKKIKILNMDFLFSGFFITLNIIFGYSIFSFIIMLIITILFLFYNKREIFKKINHLKKIN